ncbi:MAG: protein-glutamate O-methyltransferase CheR [Methylophilaceae bacterium]|nr:protein-glutamate O-methyltransferase CheR [Methylophilaceae bacterium]
MFLAFANPLECLDTNEFIVMTESAYYEISDTEFRLLSKLVYDITGIVLNDTKKGLLTGRLAKRLKALGFSNYTQYIKYILDEEHAEELQFMVDSVTTNETHFFREPQHFDFLKQVILPGIRPGQMFRVWSAATSNGAEAYTIAMILADKLGETGAWEVLGTDINGSVLKQARRGHYLMQEAARIPPEYLKRFCLKGVRDQEGTFLIDRKLRQHVRFEQLNLNVETLPKQGDFDVIFLRNVLIYFDVPTKKRVVENLVPSLKPKGYFITGHAETLSGVTNALLQVKPTIYRKM